MNATDGPSDCWIELDGLRIHYLSVGVEGDAVVFLHGGSYDEAALSWRPVLELFPSGGRLLAPDLPGFGRSDDPAEPCSTEFLVRSLDRFVAAMDLGRVTLVGLSLGGMISLGYALHREQVVRGLVLVGSAGLSREINWRVAANLAARFPAGYRFMSRFVLGHPALLRRAMRLYLERPAEDDLLEELLKASLHRSRPTGWNSFLQSEVSWEGFRTTFDPNLRSFRIPTLLVHGDRDRLVPVAHSREADRRMPNSRLTVLENCGHWIPRERPRELAGLISAFLADLPP